MRWQALIPAFTNHERVVDCRSGRRAHVRTTYKQVQRNKLLADVLGVSLKDLRGIIVVYHDDPAHFISTDTAYFVKE